MKWTKAGAAFLAAVVMTSSLSLGAFADDDYENQISDLNSKYDELEKQQQALQKEIDKAKTEKERQQAVKAQIDNQIVSTRSQISVLSDKISLLEENLQETTSELEQKEYDISENYALMKQRLRVMYTTGNASVLGLLIGADSFTEYLTRTEVASKVAEHDQEMLEAMRAELLDIKAFKEEIETNKTEIESAKGQLAGKQAQLDDQLKETEGQIQDLAALEAQIKNNQEEIEAQQKQIQAEIDEIYKQINSVGEYTGGVMGWPLVGFNTVTSNFGWRFNHTDYHTGIDIAGKNAAGQGVYGKPIVAASDGVVAFTQTNYVVGKGYGIYLIIDHGGGISTLYGHTSGLAVKVGDQVKRGQTIAYVGSTGWSTGPHLHFEVRVDGKYVNPWGYLK
ncbi:MAG TPA: peptidoglycan DD-metalloendopeptidase family protein [Candidatus Fimivivens faecavium]|nr:peptidoglycan DD-metalloendopeptidase family protein [Candidatus Fimivivens faecavium]